jgi:hypothetical protein
MPYEETSKDEYQGLLNKMDTFKPHLVNKYEREKNQERELEDSSCDTGICPVR